MNPKSGKPCALEEPKDPEKALDADVADPGKVEEIKKEQKKTKTGKYGSTEVDPSSAGDPGGGAAPSAEEENKEEDEKKKPTIKVKWSKAKVQPDQNSAFPPASAPTDTIPAKSKVTPQVDTTEVPDGTSASITIMHCSTDSAVSDVDSKLSKLVVQGNKVVDSATGKPPEWTFHAGHTLWDPWDKPFYYFKATVDHEGLADETPMDFKSKEGETLRQEYWHMCVSDAIADTPAGGNLTTGAEMVEIAGILGGLANHQVGQQAFNQNNVPVSLWGSVLRNTYAYHHASHGDIVDRTTGAQLDAKGKNPPTDALGNWRSVIVLGRTDLGDAEVSQEANVPSTAKYLAYLDTCVAGWEPSFANAFISRGTRNVLAFRMYIPDGDARQMARDFYKRWVNTHKCDPTKIPDTFFETGAPYYDSMRPVLFGDGGGAIGPGKNWFEKVVDAVVGAVKTVVNAVASLFK